MCNPTAARSAFIAERVTWGDLAARGSVGSCCLHEAPLVLKRSRCLNRCRRVRTAACLPRPVCCSGSLSALARPSPARLRQTCITFRRETGYEYPASRALFSLWPMRRFRCEERNSAQREGYQITLGERGIGHVFVDSFSFIFSVFSASV